MWYHPNSIHTTVYTYMYLFLCNPKGLLYPVIAYTNNFEIQATVYTAESSFVFQFLEIEQ